MEVVTEGAVRGGATGTRPSRRVLMVCEWHLKYATWLSAALADHGARLRLLTRTHDLEFGGEAGHADPGTMERWVAETLGARAPHLQLPGRVRELGALPDAARLWAQLRGFRPEVVHLQDAVVHDLRLAAVAGALPRRYAVTVHDVDSHPGDFDRSPRIRYSRRALLRGAGLLFVHTEQLRERLIEREGVRRPIEVIPHGTGASAPRPLPEAPSLLFFGRISEYKGVDVLLDAMEAVWAAVADATLTIAGYGTLPEHPALADPRVRVRNEYVPEDEMESVLTGARCIVLPYQEASQSGVGSRAMQYGRPMVVTDVGGLPDLVAGGGGTVVPAGDSAALAGALVDVLSDPVSAERMARAAAQSAREAGWDRVAERTLDAYERHLLA